MDTKAGAGRLSIATKAGFGVADLGGNLFFTAMGFWALNYLTDTVALPAAAAGIALMIGKVWDAVTDPMMGYVSDRTKTRLGRRRPYILGGAVPLALSMWFFFSNPGLSSPLQLTLWAVFALCLVNTMYTIVNIPYSALTPELTQDYNERTSLNGWRFSFSLVGTILGAVAILPIVGAFPTKSAGFSAAGLFMGAVMAVSALITFFAVREPGHETREIPTEGLVSTYKAVFANRAYVILIVAYALNILAINFVQSSLVYYFKYIFGQEGMTMYALGALLVVSILTIPVSIPVSKKIGKHVTYILGFAILAASCVLIFFTGHLFGVAYVVGLMCLAGLGLGFALVAPWAMVPDTIEWDAKHTGNRKEGAYYGMWTFISKLGQALSLGVSGLILSASGYVADAVQGASSIFAIRLLAGIIPAAGFALGLYVMTRYPITEKVYRELFAEETK